ncbi:MAG: hypothetical protein RDU24_13740 [Humidesulfovibrio sp.]|uniref:hypothetical protein n=1 Tax=Humidesulfovibrio sp. TaxID=2910988 RepID=UPI0027E9D3B0|nr:hypothetical protein [Humidesulfovibrio sp.]MDQ7836438.1 hypothetical protein [Humidesulfovibrio sp.]
MGDQEICTTGQGRKANLTPLPRATDAEVSTGALLPNQIESILDEALMPVQAFQRLLEGDDLSGEGHQVRALDIATVLEILTAAARCTAQELFEEAVGASRD